MFPLNYAALQSIIRQRIQRRQYLIMLYLHRRAIKIQSCWRSYYVRSNLVSSRIDDIHYAVASGNYTVSIDMVVIRHHKLSLELLTIQLYSMYLRNLNTTVTSSPS